MNEHYEYVGKTLTPKIAQELIIELLGGATVQKQEIVRTVDEAHTERGGQLPTSGASRPVTHALSKMKQSGFAENPEHGVWVIKPARIKTLAEFMKWAKKFDPGQYVFRGVTNETYKIQASAYRRLKNEDDRNFERFLEINKDLIDETILRGYDERNGRQFKQLEMLAELQHHGAATCLIDFSYSAQIALWFACGQDSKTSQDCDSKTLKDCENSPNGKVFAVYNQLPDFKKVKSNMLNNDIDFFLQDEETSPLYYWQPRQQNNRIIAQQSIFLFGRPEFDAYDECVILADNKQDILTELKQVSGITEAMLFPDFEKFAFLRREEKPYIVRSAHEYTELAREQFNRERLNIYEYDKAIGYYDRAINQDPDYVEAYYLRGRAKLDYGHYEPAILDFNMFISRNRDYAEAYYYRAMAKFNLGQTDQIDEDIQMAIQLANESGNVELMNLIVMFISEIDSLTEGGLQDE